MINRPLEYCFNCNDATGRAGQGDGSLYCECDEGPFCEDCWEEHHQGNSKANALRELWGKYKELLRNYAALSYAMTGKRD
ncbi:hypothetical protein LCGC14_0660230 [marine sediment metagenome]|uniref:Uncharacterized protein n=1 Tax=marine sediment metagenome TaxID=412755 RepID=A0A0F9QTR0_9ZZZZ